MNDVERIYNDLTAVRTLLESHGQMSDRVSFEEISAKTIVLAAASYFEKEVTSTLLTIARETGSNRIFCTFIDKQALERRFHSMFSWRAPNANAFFGLFGPDVKDWFIAQIKANEDVSAGVREFMFLGGRRNEIVHGNFAVIAADITFEEAFKKFKTALNFVSWLPETLRAAAKQQEEAVGG